MGCKALLHNQAQDLLRKHNRSREKGDTASGVRLSAVSYSLFSLWFCSWLSELWHPLTLTEPVKAPASWLRTQQWSPENYHECRHKPYNRTQSHDAWKPPHIENVPSEWTFFLTAPAGLTDVTGSSVLPYWNRLGCFFLVLHRFLKFFSATFTPSESKKRKQHLDFGPQQYKYLTLPPCLPPDTEAQGIGTSWVWKCEGMSGGQCMFVLQ